MFLRKRWYDEEPIVSEAFWALEKLPLHLQFNIAKYINNKVQEQKHSVRLAVTYDKVGRISPKRVLGLYLAGLRRRWHDKDPLLRRAFNSLVFINRTDLVEIATGIVKIEETLHEQEEEEKDISKRDLSEMLSSAFQNLEKQSVLAYHRWDDSNRYSK